ncbi:MAG: hypothetical protein KKG60_04015, partial [Nanoarchaeota archaeon]|nr:hypothetical protein [Nanoarchaeota archaeon]
EIKSHLKDSRLTKSFASFLEKYNPKIGYMLSKDYEDRRRIKNTIINFMPFVRFIEKPLK